MSDVYDGSAGGRTQLVIVGRSGSSHAELRRFLDRIPTVHQRVQIEGQTCPKRRLADLLGPGQCLLEPDDAEVPDTTSSQVTQRPQVRNGPEFDACSHAATDEIIDWFDIDWLNCDIADPLS